MTTTLIRGATLVDAELSWRGDLLIVDGKIDALITPEQ